MFKFSFPSIGVVFHRDFGVPYLNIRIRQLHICTSLGDPGDGFGSYLNAYLDHGWDDHKSMPIVKSLVFLGKRSDF